MPLITSNNNFLASTSNKKQQLLPLPPTMKFTTLITLSVATSMAVFSAMAAPSRCPSQCPPHYMPVCAKTKDGSFIPFENNCRLSVYNCKNPKDRAEFAYDGVCGTPAAVLETRAAPAAQCSDKCPAIYKPVCAQTKTGSLVSFENSCRLSVYNCKNPSNVAELAFEGTCGASASALETSAVPAAQCGDKCPAVYQPVCAQTKTGSLVSFGNACKMSVYNCKNPNNSAELAFEGDCEASASAFETRAAPVAVCNKVCAEIYQPVCAKLQSGAVKTFGNACELNNFNCENPTEKAQLVADAACPAPAPVCNKICTADYKPVCAKLQSGESKTFENKCVLDAFKCENPSEKVELVASGACPAAPQKRASPICPDTCPMVYKPVCAKHVDGELQTFRNSCELNIVNCNNRGVFTLVAEGACEAM
ncbi:Serine protease inhibitor Kazal-type 5 [Mortierella sp. GBA35]|nr:Serine protease inhibitor Kazal-type 5 [Mortierella sp. GBA35]